MSGVKQSAHLVDRRERFKLMGYAMSDKRNIRLVILDRKYNVMYYDSSSGDDYSVTVVPLHDDVYDFERDVSNTTISNDEETRKIFIAMTKALEENESLKYVYRGNRFLGVAFAGDAYNDVHIKFYVNNAMEVRETEESQIQWKDYRTAKVKMTKDTMEWFSTYVGVVTMDKSGDGDSEGVWCDAADYFDTIHMHWELETKQ